MQDLIQDGTDQCRLALKQLLDRRQFFAARKKSGDKKLKWSRIEHLDLLYDNIADRAESIVREARQTAVSFSSPVDVSYDSIHNSTNFASSSDDSDVSANSKGLLVDRGLTRKRSQSSRDQGSTLDLHMHASTIRRPGGHQEKRSKAHGGRKRKKQNIARSSHAIEFRKINEDSVSESCSSDDDSSRRTHEDHEMVIESYCNKANSSKTKLSKRRKSRKRMDSSSTAPQSTRGNNGIQGSAKFAQSMSTGTRFANEFSPRLKKHSLENTKGCVNTNGMVSPKNSAASRMHHFLAANSNTIDRSVSGLISESKGSKSRRYRRIQKPGQVRDKKYDMHHPHSSKQHRVRRPSASHSSKNYRGRTSGTSTFEVNGNNRCFFQEEALYLMLEKSNGEVCDKADEIQTRDGAKMPISQLCDKLTQSFVNDHQSAIALIRLLPSYFDINNSSDFHLRESALIAFQTILKVIKKYGLPSLQEMIQTCNMQLLVNLNLLICVVRLLDLSAHSQLTHSDGLIFELFTLNGPTSFLNMIMLQVLDVVYSQVLPVQWGSPRPLSQEVITGLLELKNAIGKVTHSLEAVSRLLMNQFGCQKWHRSDVNCENPWFVSAVDPKALARHWCGGSNGKLCLSITLAGP